MVSEELRVKNVMVEDQKNKQRKFRLIVLTPGKSKRLIRPKEISQETKEKSKQTNLIMRQARVAKFVIILRSVPDC